MRILSYRVTAALILALLWCGAAQAQLPLTGAGLGTTTAAPSYQGPGDVFAGAFVWYSCSRAYSTSYAAGLGNMCRVTRTSDSAQCILKVKANGFADTTSANCNGNTQTIVQFCNATTCGIDTAYDQSGNSRDCLEATAANQMPLAFSVVNGLPAMDCTTCSAGNALLCQTSSTFTINADITMSAAVERTGGTAIAGAIGANGASPYIGFHATNQFSMSNGAEITATANTSVWHGLNVLLSKTAGQCAYNIDNSDTAGQICGTTGLSATNIRLTRSNSQFTGYVAEAGIWQATSTSTNRGNLYANQHGANGYNGAF